MASRFSDQPVDGEHGAVVGLGDAVAEAIYCCKDGADRIFPDQVLLEVLDCKLLT